MSWQLLCQCLSPHVWLRGCFSNWIQNKKFVVLAVYILLLSCLSQTKHFQILPSLVNRTLLSIVSLETFQSGWFHECIYAPAETTKLSFNPGGVLPYITYTGMCRPKGSWFWSCWFRTGYPFQRRFLERGIKFRTHESSTFVSSHVKVFKDRLLLKIRFNALTSKLLYSCCTLERSIKNWPISRTGYRFRGNTRTGYKKLAHF